MFRGFFVLSPGFNLLPQIVPLFPLLKMQSTPLSVVGFLFVIIYECEHSIFFQTKNPSRLRGWVCIYCGTSRIQLTKSIVPLIPKVKIQTMQLTAAGILFS
jgi:hypothetical protein